MEALISIKTTNTSQITLRKSANDERTKPPQKMKRTFENCENCPPVVYNRETNGTLVCLGDDRQMHISSFHSTIANVSSRQCKSICSCEYCATCAVEAHSLPERLSSNGKTFKWFPGQNHHMLLRFDYVDGREFVAKMGRGVGQVVNKVDALRRIRDECGFEDIVPEERVGPFRARLSNDSEAPKYVTCENAVFSEYFNAPQLMEFERRVPHNFNQTQVVRAALHDFLLGIGGRFPGNILFQPNGNIKLIDNHDLALGNTVDGMFFPGSRQWNERPKFSKVLDYRCNTQTSMLYRDYPTQVQQCLETISNSTIEQLVGKFSLPSFMDGVYLQERTQWMLVGLEYAIIRNFKKYPAYEQYRLTGRGLPLKVCASGNNVVARKKAKTLPQEKQKSLPRENGKGALPRESEKGNPVHLSHR